MSAVSTGLNLTLEAAYLKEQYNRNAKAIISHTILLAWILKNCVSEFADYPIEYIQSNCIEGSPVIGKEAVHQNVLDADRRIQGSDTQTSSIDEEENTFDIRFNAVVPESKEPLELFINIEFQKKTKSLGYPLPKRGGYYCARMISKQYGTVFTHSEYEKIRKVYSIWICPNAVNDEEDSVVKYQIQPEVVHGNVITKPDDYDILNITIISLTKHFQKSQSDIVRLLGTIFIPLLTYPEKVKSLEEDFGIPMTRNLEEGLTNMCNLADGIFEYGIQEGQKRGEMKGEIKGAVKLYHDEMNLLPSQIVPKIMTRFNLTQEEAEKYVEAALGLELA